MRQEPLFRDRGEAAGYSCLQVSCVGNHVAEAPWGRALGLSRRQSCQVKRRWDGVTAGTLDSDSCASRQSRAEAPVALTVRTALGLNRHLHSDGELGISKNLKKCQLISKVDANGRKD